MKNFRKYLSLALLVGFAHTGIGYGQATDARVRSALRFVDLGNCTEAVSSLRTLTTQDNKNAEAHAGLAMALLCMNDVNGAATEAQEGFEIDRRNVLVRNARGMVYGRQSNVSGALGEFNSAIKQNDKEIGSYLNLAHYYLSIDSLKPAEVTLYRAQQINDKDVRTYLGLAELYERQHIPDLAISQYEQAKKIDANDVTVMAHLAQMYFRAHRYNESAGEWVKVLRIDSTYAPAYFQVGNLYFLARQYQNSAAYANKYALLKPDDINGQWLLARSLTELGQYQQALPALQRVAAVDSLKGPSQLLLARSYFYSKDYPKALGIYSSTTNLSPWDYNYYGLAKVVSGDTLGGIAQLQTSLTNDTIRTPQQKLEAMTLIGRLQYSQKNYSAAAKTFGSIAEANPTVDWYLAAGQMYTQAKQPDLAGAYYQKALALEPGSLKVLRQMALETTTDMGSAKALESFEALATAAKAKNSMDTLGEAEGYLGYHFATKKEWAKAATHLDEAVKLVPKASPLLLNFEVLRAQSYVQLKENTKAQEAVESGLRLDPANKTLKELRDYLKKAGK